MRNLLLPSPIASQRIFVTIDVATSRVVVTAKRTMLYLNGKPHEIWVSITNFFLLVTDVLQVIHYVPDQFFFWRRLPGCVCRWDERSLILILVFSANTLCKLFSKWVLFASNSVCPGIGLWLFGKSNVYWGCDKIWKTCHQPLSEVIEVHNTSQLHSSSTESGFVYPCPHHFVTDFVLFWHRTADLCINHICLNQVF